MAMSNYTDEELKALIKEGTLYLQDGIVYMKTDLSDWSMSFTDMSKEHFISLSRELKIDDLL